MKTHLLLLIISIFSITSIIELSAQGVSINDDGAPPDESAMLDIKSTTKGLLIPRMSFGDLFALSNPANGLIVYCTSFNSFYYYNGTSWQQLAGGADDDWTIDGDNMYSNNSGLIGIGTTTTLPTHKLTIENSTNNNLLRLIGTGSYGEYAKINFGDGEYVYIQEFFDDKLMVYANSGLGLTSNFNIEVVSGYGTVQVYTPEGNMSIKDDPSAADASAILDVNSSTKGMLIPRMTTAQIQLIDSPADGLQVYNTSDGKLYIFVGSANLWKEVSYGTGIIAIQTFEACGDNLVDMRDGQSYGTVEINGQCWMAENLNYGTMIPTNYNPSTGSTIEKYCYNNSTSYCDALGGLYQWNEMMNYNSTAGGQGICPDGWHVPTDQEWFVMENYLDPSISNINMTGWRGSSAGIKLKNSGSGPPFNWAPGNAGTNESGFTALPGGIRTTGGSSGYNPTNGVFWTSTYASGYAMEREMHYTSNGVYRGTQYLNTGASLRCIKD
jgi:uncharacterized protein (TIGR02145 family)